MIAAPTFRIGKGSDPQRCLDVSFPFISVGAQLHCTFADLGSSNLLSVALEIRGNPALAWASSEPSLHEQVFFSEPVMFSTPELQKPYKHSCASVDCCRVNLSLLTIFSVDF